MLQLSFILVLILSGLCLVDIRFVAAQTCSDCTYARECPAAEVLLRRNSQSDIQILKNAYCGHIGPGRPGVCCSQVASAQSDVNVESHPNLSLLPSECGVMDDDRIIGGTEAGLYEFPWMVLISHRTREGLKFQCGGTLINNRYVLTAAHCIKDLNVAGVRVGEHDLRTHNDCQGQPPKTVCVTKIQDIAVSEAIPHLEFRGKPFVKNDIGLLRLRKAVNFIDRKAAAICLPVSKSLREQNLAGSLAKVAGWGITESTYTSSVLLYADVPVHTVENCRKFYNRVPNMPEDTTVNKTCAGTNGKDSCSGDSGGPLMVTGRHNGLLRYVQHGIVSYGPRQCGSDFPGVYTSVSKYMSWILDNIRA